MKRLALAVLSCGLAGPAFAQGSAQSAPGTPAAATRAQASEGMDRSCGEVLSENAKYPRQMKTTLAAVADLFEAHANWVGTSTPAAKAEHEALTKLAAEHRAAARQAQSLASTMQSYKSLPEATHDMQNVPETLLTAMGRARDEQRRLGHLLLQGAQEMDQRLNAMQGVGGSGAAGTSPQAPAPGEPTPSHPRQ